MMEAVSDQRPSAPTLNAAGSRVKLVVLLSLGLTIALALVKYLLYRFTGSLAVQADAYHSGSDVIAGLLVLVNCTRMFAARRWIRLASGLGITVLIVLSALKVGYEAYQGGQTDPVHLSIAIPVTLGAIAVSYLLAQYKIRIGCEENFPLLVMEGQHTLTDALSSGVVLIGILGQKTGIRLDAACALVIAILILGIAVEVAREMLREEGWWQPVRAAICPIL
jgi:cation diffusion facilitator family transporter